MKILAIESSCDETAAAVVEDGRVELASIVATSKELHEATGGVVPEVAARKQVEFIVPVIDQTLAKFERAGFSKNDIDTIAVTVGPGLIGSLVVGVEAAKALALVWDKPLVPVNHLVGHVYANWLHDKSKGEEPKEIKFPAVVLLVSGGHTDLVLMTDHGKFEYLGGTLDDAAGEAFDKTARILGLSQYLGGVLLSKKATECAVEQSKSIVGHLFPRPMLHDETYDFSFSGLKTAAKRVVEANQHPVELVCKEFEEAVVDVLVGKTLKAMSHKNAKTLLLGGGVSANSLLRGRLKTEAERLGFELHIPPLSLCTDNAVYIAAAAYFNYNPVSLESIGGVRADPSIGIMD